ncbi:putative ABC transport system permease protein [Blastococcus aurantiacus]|uniref:Putative ABC transport system permease protein n=1 Tax=Blastococcus aurantiacus TaxID=1550231 RepID=A0A1G7QW25_9ACTN|nr:ABC transporter permease [Blastococcus aurantiacus]SDG02731.1 putative ABC transport system permease protein [Blastococcus aurantiacus]
MWRTTWRSLLAHKLRLALSGLAIVLGVAFVVGTLIFTDTLSKTFNDLFESTAADVNVTRAAAFDQGLEGTGTGGTATYVPAGLVDEIADVEGVAAVEGNVQAEGVYILDADGEVLDTGGAPGIGISWDTEESLSPTTLVDGRAATGPGEVMIDTNSAEDTGYRVGDTITVLTPGPRVEAELVGTFRFGDEGGLAGASLTAFDTTTAQELLSAPGQFTGIGVGAADGVDPDELADRVAAVVGSDYDVKTASEQAESLSSDFSEALQFINIFLLVFAAIALFVGTFIILNTFSMLVAQRTRELALLRALGASRGQVTRSVLGEALVVGLVGSTLGLAAGYGIAAGLRALFGSFGLTLDGDLVLSTDTVLWAYAVGVLVTLVSAYVPARRAARMPPVAAMRDDVVTAQRGLRRRTVVGAVLAAVGIAALVGGTLSDDGGTGASLVGLGALALILGATALSPVLAVPFLRSVGALLPRIWGTTGRLAQENAVRNPRRTAATASALMIGLALVSAFSVIGASTNASIDELVTGSVRAEFVVSSAVQVPFSGDVAAELAEVDGVDAIMPLRWGQAQLDGRTSFLTAVDPDSLDRSIELSLVDGSTERLGGNGLLVDESTADGRGWAVGDTVEVLTRDGRQQELVVRGVFESNQVIGSTVVSLDSLTAFGGVALDRFLFVDLADDVAPADVRPQLEEVTDAYPVVDLKDRGEFSDEQKSSVDQLLLLINAMLVLSVLIAALGIVNTLAMSVIERTREIGLLRAVGLGRAQLRRMVRLEAVVISIYGAVLGLVLGTLFGVALSRSLADQGITELVVPLPRMAVFLLVAAVIGVLAAVGPARRAARLKVLDAIAQT